MQGAERNQRPVVRLTSPRRFVRVRPWTPRSSEWATRSDGRLRSLIRSKFSILEAVVSLNSLMAALDNTPVLYHTNSVRLEGDCMPSRGKPEDPTHRLATVHAE